MNHANSTVDTESMPSRHASSRAPPAKRSGSGLEVRHLRGGELMKITKSGEINPRLVCLLQPNSVQAESYFRLRHTLEQMAKPEIGIVIGVTSPAEGDGKTVTAINLAGALAQDAHARVLLVDLNLRQAGAGVRRYFDLQQDADSGVSDFIGGEPSIKGPASYHLPALNLHLVLSGNGTNSPYELLKSPRLDELFHTARQDYDYIIVDTPQTLLLPDIELISRVVDGFLIVVKADDTPREKLEETLNLMTQDKVLGLIFNGTTAQS